MATITKTAGISVLALQSVAAGAVVISGEVDLSDKLAANFFIRFGRRAATALTVGTRLRIDANPLSSGGYWIPIWEQVTQIAAAADEAVNGACASGQAEVPMASTTGFAVGDLVFIDNGTIANSEWVRVILVHGNVHITAEENLANTQTGSTCYNKAELYAVQVDATAFQRMRLVVDNTGSGQAIAVMADAMSADSVG